MKIRKRRVKRRTISPNGKILREKIPFINIFPAKWKQNAIFLQTWQNWTEHRKEIKRKLTERAAELQRNKLTSHPIPVAVVMINRSIENRWTGIFEARDQEIYEEEEDGDEINIGFQDR